MKNDIVKWLRDWFDKNGKDCNAVIHGRFRIVTVKDDQYYRTGL